ncbi:MAG: Vitamin B12 dependent methionine synthase activation subunit [Clostridia bacterium]|nr:Vitamin B12 dependent methionine synthase activation subunit [Clostridia bacterium]
MTEIRTMYMVNPLDLVIQRKEVLRYLKASKTTPEADVLIDECLKDVYKIVSPRAVYIETNVELLNDDVVKFDFMEIKSHSLTVNLKRCKKAYIFAATLGIELDRMIERYSRFIQSKATVCHAVGSALIESFCNYVDETLVGRAKATRRFSPGYGDLSLEIQPDILKALDAERKIGIILGDSLLMQPSKSVTAIIGIK